MDERASARFVAGTHR